MIKSKIARWREKNLNSRENWLWMQRWMGGDSQIKIIRIEE